MRRALLTGSAGLLLLNNERIEHFDDELLLGSWKLADAVDPLLEFGSGPTPRLGLDADDLLFEARTP
jgi:hypothetical protein